MPRRAKRICRHPGCPVLVDGGYCAAHARPDPAREAFARLDARKTDEGRSFYAARRWTEASRAHRRQEPLCRPCRAAGRVTAGQMTHHDPPLEELLSKGLDPYNDAYLITLCNNCHLGELRKKAQRQSPAF